MGLIFHQLFPESEIATRIAGLQRKIDIRSANLTSKNFLDLREAIEKALDAPGIKEALERRKTELEQEGKAKITRDLQQKYLDQDKKTEDLSARIMDYRARTSPQIIDLIARSDAIASFKIDPESKSKKASMMKLETYLLGNYAAHIIDIGLRAGLFRAVDQAGPDGITDHDLAQHLGVTHIYVAWWCKAAYAFEVLDRNGQERYTLAINMQSLLLDPDDLDFLGDEFLLSKALSQEFQDFPTYLSTGQIKSRSEIDPRVRKFYQNLTEDDAAIITHLILPQAPGVLERLHQDKAGKILDIGTGAGAALVHYATYFPQAHIVGLDIDLPTVLLAQRKIAQEAPNYADRIEMRFGDANQLGDRDDDQGAYNLITINLALHEMGGKSREVLQRVYKALKPGGAVVICAFYTAQGVAAYRNPTYQQWLSLHLHEMLLGSSLLSPEELRALLWEVGFSFEQVLIRDHPINGYLMVLAEKAL